MHPDNTDELGFDTLAIRTGHHRTAENEHSEPIFPTSSFVFANAAEAAARFSGATPGNIYARFTNPTTRTFEERLAALEGAEACVATSSGMAAILSLGLALLKAGDHVVCSKQVFGTTTVLWNKYFAKFGVDVTHVDLTDLAAWRAAIQPNTRFLFLETPSNPLTEIVEIPALAEIAHAASCLLVVDNCFCTPALQRPLLLGADVVIHSATKFLDGQGRAIGGAVCTSRALADEVVGVLRTLGPTMAPFNAWIFLKGLETLNLRMKAHSANAQRLAEWLEAHPRVSNVYYPGLESHPQHALAKRQMKGFGGIVGFEVEGGRTAAWQVIDNTRLFSITANLGDAKSTITHPASTTHGRLSDEQRAAAGIKEGLIRLAVGLEDAEDLIRDLERGLG
ncbi:MAG: O-succinylhomoserine sulfhydrylase [Gammaproteobacteria bacterium 28-57-27]|nr:MAG: O-succinylhomoserine sulfhydrylase [Gammaproteobacteria bacterium 28-57-27]